MCARSWYKARMATLRNIKHEKFARKIAEQIVSPAKPSPPAKVYSEVYGVSESSGGNAFRLLNRSDIVLRIRYLINKATPPDFLAKQLKQLSKAKKSVWYEGNRVGSEPDNAIRLETIKTILKAQGVAGDTESKIDARSVNFQINVNDAKELQSIASDLRDLNDALLPDNDSNGNQQT